MEKISVLLFDIGGVLVENTGYDALNALLPQALSDAAIREKWLRSAAVREFELGRISPSVFARRFIAEWRINLSEDRFLEEFYGWPKAFYEGAACLLAGLRENYRICCLSNSNELHWKKFNGFSGLFDIAFSSHLLQQIKPDQDIYRNVIRQLDVKPQHICFFDDSLSNVIAARQIGMSAFCVNGFQQLKASLQGQGLLK
jgi:HAD superfamily hydrolase (TIGR01509 family)